MTATEPEASSQADRIAVIAGVIRDAYGDDAIAVAERQLAMAEDHSRNDWNAIVDCLRRH